MQADGKKFAGRKTELFQDPRGRNAVRVKVEDFLHRRTRLNDPIRRQSFRQQVTPGMLGVGQVDVADVINDAAVDFLRHALVETAVAGLHVKHGNLAPLGGNGRKGAVGVPQHEHGVGLFLREHLVGFGDDITNGFGQRGARGFQKIIGLPQFEIPEKNPVQFVVVVLAVWTMTWLLHSSKRCITRESLSNFRTVPKTVMTLGFEFIFCRPPSTL